MGSETTEVAANRAWKELLESYEDPGLDPAIDEELRAYMESRRDAPELYVED
jgi:trimethylamine--corrinoid protein Co-methyltransferase